MECKNDVQFYKLKDVLKIIPISRSHWFAGVRKGHFPKPYKIGRNNVWTKEQLDKIIENIVNGKYSGIYFSAKKQNG